MKGERKRTTYGDSTAAKTGHDRESLEGTADEDSSSSVEEASFGAFGFLAFFGLPAFGLFG